MALQAEVVVHVGVYRGELQRLYSSEPQLARSHWETTNYDLQANQDIARNLKGKLLLAHGILDDNVLL